MNLVGNQKKRLKQVLEKQFNGILIINNGAKML